jgi:gentisate 1,2-dioxygenase
MHAAPEVLDELRRIDSLDALHAALAPRRLVPGWLKRARPIFIDEMRSEFLPAHWRYAEAKAAMQAAGRLIGTDLAERRNLIMSNPRPGNDIETLRTLICAYQSILPGEKARSHRHASHALRVIIESRGSYSVVNGHRHPMETGDIVLTPGMCWHGHGHDGAEQAYWFDCLDIPLTRQLETVFFEDHPDSYERAASDAAESRYRYAWEGTQAKLEHAASDPQGHFGKTIELEALDMPTLTIKVHEWPAAWSNRPFRRTANTLYVVLHGHGHSVVGDAAFDWEAGDTVAAPAWNRVEHRAGARSVVVALSDENLMRWTRFYRLDALR